MSDIITVTGNIATEPTQVTTPSGAVITRFRIASAQRRRDPATGEWIDGHVNWFTVCAYRHLGANAHASFRKGERVIVSGRLRIRRWEHEDRHGTEAEIDADALGHDLMFGTSAFTRVARSLSDTARPGAAPSGESDTWSAAGAPADQASPESDSWSPAAAPADASTEGEDVPVPF